MLRLTFAPPPPPSPLRAAASASPPVAAAAAAAAVTLSRRAVLPLLALLPLAAGAPRPARARDASLVELVRLRDSLRDLSADVEVGTNADVRRVVRTLLRATDVPRNLPAAVRRLPAADRDAALVAGRDAYEYLNQVVEYYDATANRERPSARVLAFWLQCIGTAADRLDELLTRFDADEVRVARELVLGAQ